MMLCTLLYKWTEQHYKSDQYVEEKNNKGKLYISHANKVKVLIIIIQNYIATLGSQAPVPPCA